MRSTVLFGILSLWIFSILAPSVITIANQGEEVLLVLCHNEEEQQETGKKDSVEEKIIPEVKYHVPGSGTFENFDPRYNYTLHSSNHIAEIHLPPPEHSTHI